MRIEVQPFGVKVVIVELDVVKTGFDSVVAGYFINTDNDYEITTEKFRKSFIKKEETNS
ncbi:hypothetical protein [uncultured Clostridium sp.]|uniref:hypothetical protein n=1 Tax=uncultured Clostridium sp. TaxID=59620 RepID=UPI0026235C6B|nr:hypothetical protein [uncultured Clostridium sp.]